METVTIWRVISSRRLGVFYEGILDDFAEPRFNNYSEYPSPPRDKGIGREAKYYEHCGCANTDQLLHWFGAPEVLARLLERDAKLLELSIPPHAVVVGDKQVLFDHNRAKVVKTHHIKKLYELARPAPDNQLQLSYEL